MVNIPKGAQLLFFPMKECTISAGFKNKQYKAYYGYNHYGTDFDSLGAMDFPVIAGGNGVILGVEMNNTAAGGIVVIRYNSVYNPTLKKVQDLIVRYAHMISLSVKKGESVKAYQQIGMISGNHK